MLATVIKQTDKDDAGADNGVTGVEVLQREAGPQKEVCAYTHLTLLTILLV